MMVKAIGVCVLVLAGCTGENRVGRDDYGTGGAPTTAGEGGDLWTTLPDDGSCCGAGDLSLFTEGDAPCPEGTSEGFTAHAELIPSAPHTCTDCSCSPAVCALPEGMLTFPAPCPGDGAALPFGPDLGSGWDGSCSQANAHPANELCDGVPCVQSLWVPATTVAPCAPSGAVPSKPAWTWGRRMRQCRLLQQGCGAGQVCVPRVVPDGFDLCRYATGNEGCPEGYYSEPSVFYMGVNDARGCNACDCGPPEGAQCATYVSVYKNGDCSSPVVQTMISTVPLCLDITPGSALGSTDAATSTDIPGNCAASGGEPTGDLEPAEPVTLCCPRVAE